MAKIYATSLDVTADAGEVHGDGSGGVSVSRTPEAVAETSDRLPNGAAPAIGQTNEEKRLQEERRSLGFAD